MRMLVLESMPDTVNGGVSTAKPRVRDRAENAKGNWSPARGAEGGTRQKKERSAVDGPAIEHGITGALGPRG